ncbi:oligosaccharide flippase family protein [Psychrobacter sp.]|uniref:oligosaccharide flippase family protein n=1 Tax=Psychrobacter sp. TaxID=56811 RepID=UPI003F993C08
MQLKYKKAVIHTSGALAYAFSQWLILTFSTRFISLETAGLYVYYLGIFTPASILLSFGLRNAIASDSKRLYYDSGYKLAQLSGLLLMIVYSVIIFLIAKDDLVIAVLVLCIKIIEMYSEVIYGSWVRSSVAERYGLSKILKLALFLPLFYILYIRFGANKLILFSYPIAMLVIVIIYDRKRTSLETETKSFPVKDVLEIIKVSLPLAIGSFIVSLNSSGPRILIKNIIGEEDLALYVIITYFISLAIIPIASLCQTFIPYFSRIDFNNSIFQDKKIKKIILLVLGYGLLFSAGMLVFINLFVGYVYKISYEYSLIQIVLVSLTGVLQFFNILFNSILVSLRKFKVIMKITLISVTVTLILTYPLTMYFGLTGAYTSYLISSLFLLFSSSLYIYKRERNVPELFKVRCE